MITIGANMKYIKYLAVAMAIAAVSSCSEDTMAPAPSRLLATVESGPGVSGSRVILTEADFAVWLGLWDVGSDGDCCPDYRLFEDFSFGLGDAGKSVQIGGDRSDADFSSFRQLLTDGESNEMEVASRKVGISASHGNEALLQPANGAPLQPDLQGHTITHFILFVDEVAIDSPGTDPNGDGVWTDSTFRWHLEVHGR